MPNLNDLKNRPPRVARNGLGGLQCTEPALILPFRYELTSSVAACLTRT